MADEKMATTKQLIDEAQRRAEARRDASENRSAKRELSIAITALEDARTRFARAIEMEMGTHEERDMELIERGVENTMQGMREAAAEHAAEDLPAGAGG